MLAKDAAESLGFLVLSAYGCEGNIFLTLHCGKLIFSVSLNWHKKRKCRAVFRFWLVYKTILLIVILRNNSTKLH